MTREAATSVFVYAFKVPAESNAGKRKFYEQVLNLRDALAKKIPGYEALFGTGH